MNSYLKITLSILLFTQISCSKIDTNFFKKGISEGIIKYDLSFPYLNDDQMQIANLLPDEMIYTFTKNENQALISSIGFKTIIHAREKTKELKHYVKVLSKKVRCEYDQKGVVQLLDTYPEINIIKTNETDTVAGVLCKKAIGVFTDIAQPHMDIYYTDEFNVQTPNWCNQFAELEGTLMMFEMEQFNLRMQLKAYEVEKIGNEEIEFLKDESYKSVNAIEMNHELEEIFTSFF